MRVVFIGSSKFGLRCLELLSKLEKSELVGVVTAPREFSISYRPAGVVNILHADVQGFCEDQIVPFVEIQNGMKDPGIMDKVCVWKPDIFIVCGWYHMVPKSWRALAPAYGMHASLLPDYSGGAPLVWSLINGESRTGITLFQLDDGVDNGFIIGQAETDISDEDDIASLYGRIEELGLGLLTEYLPQIASGSAEHRVQDERLRRLFPQRSPENGLIDWNDDARTVWNFVRAQTRPYPGAFTYFQNKEIHLWKTSITSHRVDSMQIGQITRENQKAVVQCGKGGLVIEEASYDGEGISGKALIHLIGEGGVLG